MEHAIRFLFHLSLSGFLIDSVLLCHIMESQQFMKTNMKVVVQVMTMCVKEIGK